MRRPAYVVAFGLLTLTLTACAGSPATGATPGTTVPFTMQPSLPRTGVLGFGTDHLAVDGSGAYVCVLRRGDDLASLRARYNPRD